MDRWSRRKIKLETLALNGPLDQIHLKAPLNAHGTFSRIDHMLHHKVNLGKFKKIEIISGIFSDHKALRLEINYKEKKTTVNYTNTWRLENMLLNN